MKARKTSRPRPKKKKTWRVQLPPRFGFWDLDDKGQPYYAGDSNDVLFRVAARHERGDFHLYRTLKNGRWVSTIFLWTNHAFLAHDPPILFETGAWCGDHVIICDRYSTRAEAEAGHEKWCKTYLE